MIGFVTTPDLPLEEKNRLCPALPRNGTIDRMLASLAMNPGRAIPESLGSEDARRSMDRLLTHLEPAHANLTRVVTSQVVS